MATTSMAAERRRPGPAPMLDEWGYVPLTRDESRWLFDALVTVGAPEPKARSIVGTLQTLPEHYSESLKVTIVRYRKFLVKVGEPPWDTRKRRADLWAVLSVELAAA